MRMVLLVLLLLAGCAAPESPQSPPSSPSDGRVVELVSYERQGGIAGFHDQLVVRSDGSYSLNGADAGTLPSSELADLRRALESAGFATLPTDSPLRIADGFVHTIRYGGYEIRAGDGSIPGSLEPVVDILGRIVQQQ